MSQKIFLSHNHFDKPIVEPVALRLAEIFGESEVFYDSWSIRPGDGIIDQMNKGLEAPEYVFFFVSAKSLGSQMVKLEWQNALHAATRGKTRMIPVRVDGSAMPAMLTQTLYIDMFSLGLEAAIAQIVSVTQGSASFTPQHQGFSNLTFSTVSEADGSINLSIQASHLMEPNPSFLLATSNTEDEISWYMSNGQAFFGGFNKNLLTDSNGSDAHAILFRTIGGTITPSHPLRIKLGKRKDVPVVLLSVLHESAENEWKPIPFKA
ncbi:toll/interleukin-1 receptor domain-containing protein [Pseudomonas capsici]|uniref:Toll/interleukin-1 receptor domain-containing protein n=1 Tax=Pseudomonas capsici TaxID=2810614 RepID=A0ABT3C316_9PSED|nr:toll/interleukin-1 receptor domain-containing protein [Pseudomonas capsici]MBX8610266.1 toll/interleukin-1 receptor domain-containing protein [Pseudomonas cichorii]MBN6714030.1 toll/interleukin-1 receptor domain-containing protein [Pseudomonas capsici]MBN6719414.1 toll/interleukin-1 receptor domain-containing protein [Pseudomonas capsici]MBN6722772.1 toll/interleukin-1 receptor domain-containing protein [Pseudomonas capsici]MCV4266971.1 toll/interleukin-1 receptor domain-containing protein 